MATLRRRLSHKWNFPPCRLEGLGSDLTSSASWSLLEAQEKLDALLMSPDFLCNSGPRGILAEWARPPLGRRLRRIDDDRRSRGNSVLNPVVQRGQVVPSRRKLAAAVGQAGNEIATGRTRPPVPCPSWQRHSVQRLAFTKGLTLGSSLP